MAEIFRGHGGVIGFMIAISTGSLKLARAFEAEVEFHIPPPKKEKKNERIQL